jgi:hypothetical protein
MISSTKGNHWRAELEKFFSIYKEEPKS